MSGKKQKIDYHEHDTPEQKEFPDISNVASANECTGLMYKTPLDSEELEAYQELSPMGIPKDGDHGEILTEKLHKSRTAKETGEAVTSASGEYSPRHMKE